MILLQMVVIWVWWGQILTIFTHGVTSSLRIGIWVRQYRWKNLMYCLQQRHDTLT